MNHPIRKQFLVVVLFSFLSCFSFVSAQDTLRILAIGNSFSEDAAESYFDDLAKAGGVKLIVANLYAGGCSLEKHWSNVTGNVSTYSYRKIVDGDTTVLNNTTLLHAVKDDRWDYISFQQVSQNSGMYETYFPFLTNLMQYVKSNVGNPKVIYAFHQTWAYAANATHPGFANYNKDQMLMYRSIINAVNRATKEAGIDLIIPSGTAIQNARSSYLGDVFNRDGYHLTYGLGRYTAACVWYEKMLGKSVVGNPYYPKSITKEEANIAQNAAHDAVLNPFIVTSMADFAPAVPVKTK